MDDAVLFLLSHRQLIFRRSSLTPLAHMLKCKVFSCIRTDSTFSATIKSFLTLRQFSVTCGESFKVESVAVLKKGSSLKYENASLKCSVYNLRSEFCSPHFKNAALFSAP